MNKKNLTVNIILVAVILLLISQLTKNSMLFALSFPFVSVFWMWLGAMKNNKVRGIAKYSLSGLLIIWIITFVSMVSMDNSKVSGYFLGLPNGSAIMVYATWFLPFLIVTLVYGLRFEKDYITKEDIDEFCKIIGDSPKTVYINSDKKQINV